MFSVSIECFKHIDAVQQQNEVFSITFVLVWLVLRFQVFLHYFAKQSLSCASKTVCQDFNHFMTEQRCRLVFYVVVS